MLSLNPQEKTHNIALWVHAFPIFAKLSLCAEHIRRSLPSLALQLSLHP